MPATERPRVLVFRSQLLPYSEPFILFQYEALRRYQPYYVGLRRVPGLDVPPERSLILNEAGGVAGKGRELAYTASGWAPGFVRRLRELAPVLFHAQWGTNAVRSLPLVRRLGVPFVVTFRGSDITRHDSQARGKALRRRAYLRGRDALRHEADLVLASSEFIRRILLEKGFPEEKVRVHYNGIDLDSFHPRGAVRRQPVVLFVGRLVEKKGVAHLIRAMAQVQRTRPEVELVVVGEGPLQAHLERLARASLRKVRFTGTIPRSAVRDWMEQARVLCAPSQTASSGDTDSLPNVLVEAQAMGLPAVAFASGGVPEAIAHGETGWLAREGDWESLARYVLSLFEDEHAWRAMSARGPQRVRVHFDLKRQTLRLERLYDEVLANGRDVPATRSARSRRKR